jgi:TolB-like protein
MAFVKSMRLIIVAIGLIFAISSLSAEEKLSIAVMDFKITNLAKDEVELLFDFLSNALFETQVFDVIQKSKRNELLKEIEFSASDAANAEKTNKIGKLLSAKLLLFGSIGKIGTNILYSLTLVDVESGKTVSTYSKTYKKLEEIVDDFSKIGEELAGAAKKMEFIRKANVLYFEDFVQHPWAVSDKVFYQDNKVHIFNKESQWYAWDLLNADDFTLEVEAEFISGEDGGYGGFFRSKDIDNLYEFLISKNGYFRVSKYLDGTFTKLADWETSSSINKKGVNYLKVEALGKRMAFYINKRKVKELTDTTFSEGNFGLTSAKGVHAAFDNLLAYQGKLSFFDSFSADNGEWSSSKMMYIKDGEYNIDPPKDSGAYYGWGRISFSDCIYKAEIKLLSGPDDATYGIAFRIKDVNNQYVFLGAKNGVFEFGYYKDGTWKTLIPWKKTDVLNASGKNILGVECRGSRINLIINGTLVDSLTDTTFTKGMIGLMCYEGVKVACDNVQVFATE